MGTVSLEIEDIMIDITPLEKLGQMDEDWLSARFHFSFAGYQDPDRMGFGPLRVWNDDLFRPGGGFPMHPHRDMEIITYIRTGAISHQDNTGGKGVTRAGEVQVMTAGTGIVHSEFNEGDTDLTLFQIWIEPSEPNLEPRWETRDFNRAERRGRWAALASGRPIIGDGDADALHINQDAALMAVELEAGGSIGYDLAPGRRAYLVPASGAVTVNGKPAPERSGVAITEETELTIEATDGAEVVLLDLP